MNTDSTDLRAHLASDVHRGFANLVASYQHQLYAFLLRRLGNPQEAEDIVQETFLQAYYTLKRYPAERIRTLALRAWLYKIARNVQMNSVRRFKPPTVSLETLEDTLGLEQEEETTQPERILEELELRQELETLIQGLPSQYAETVMLYYREEARSGHPCKTILTIASQTNPSRRLRRSRCGCLDVFTRQSRLRKERRLSLRHLPTRIGPSVLLQSSDSHTWNER
jgi:RNA polymerase sigma-70 factor, ECF subfamily